MQSAQCVLTENNSGAVTPELVNLFNEEGQNGKVLAFQQSLYSNTNQHILIKIYLTKPEILQAYNTTFSPGGTNELIA